MKNTKRIYLTLFIVWLTGFSLYAVGQTFGIFKIFEDYISMSGTEAVNVPGGTTAQRPSGTAGDLRYNTDTSSFEGYTDAWGGIGGDGGGGINYLSGADSNANSSVGNWGTYADAAGENAVDGDGGSATLTFTQNTTTPMRDAGDFKFAKDAANRQGEGASVAFTIDNADQAQMITISLDYNASDSDYADDDIRFQVYDVTNANLIRINGEDLKGGKGTHYAQFQAAPDSTSYRLIIHQSSTNAAAYDLYLDNIQVGPSEQGVGGVGVAATRMFRSGTQSVSADTGAVKVQLNAVAHDATNSADTSTNYRFTAPESGYYSVNAQAFLSGLTSGVETQLYIYKNGSVYSGRRDVDAATTRYMPFSGDMELEKGDYIELFVVSAADGTYDIEQNYTFMSAHKIGQSNEQASVNSGRDVEFNASLTTTQSIPTGAATKIQFNTINTDTASGWDGTDDYVVPETGYYTCSLGIEIAANSTGLRDFQVAGKSIKFFPSGQVPTSGALYVNGSVTVYKEKGSTISATVNQGSGGNLNIGGSGAVYNYMTITKVPNPQTPLLTSRVAARYNSSSLQTVNSTKSLFTYENKDYDDLNMMSSGVVTIPVSGVYRVSSRFLLNTAAYTLNQYIELSFYKNGSTILGSQRVAFSGGSQIGNMMYSDEFELEKGDTIEPRAFSSVSTTSSTNATFNSFTIHRVK